MRADARKRSDLAMQASVYARDLCAELRKSVRPFPLVGVIGKKRHGKDTFASALVEERGFTRVAFADPLKEAALALDPIVGAISSSQPGTPPPRVFRLSAVVDEHGWEKAKEVPEVRRTLQNYGVAIRGIDVDFWVNAAMKKVSEIDGPVVVTDVRFPNEADAIVQAGGTLVRVVRPGVESFDSHASETALDRYTVKLTALNAGSVEDLRNTALSLF